MMLFAVALITMMAALHAYAAPDRKTFALASLAFVSYFLPSDLQRAFRKPNRVATEQSRSLALAVPSTLV
jgi:hypothetical protein